MHDPAYAVFSALDLFFDIVMRGLAGLVRYYGANTPRSKINGLT